MGYATGQFGKNHFGDLNKYLPTVHGFDEFFGNLYHLNAEEEPEEFDYPHKDQFPKLYELAHPRGVLKCKATDEVSKDPDDPKYGPVGKQAIEDTGPLNRKRMETIDDETTTACIDYIRRQHEAGTPFFVWMNMTHMHCWTHTKPESRGQAGLWQSAYHDTMIDHDKNVGQLLDLLDELGMAEDTIVVYSTDNGPTATPGPTGRPRRSAARRTATGRAPSGFRKSSAGPAKSRPGWCPTRSFSTTIGYRPSWPRRANRTSSRSSRRATRRATRSSRFTSTAYNLLPYLTGEVETSPRRGFIYFSDDCDVLGIRFENWKIVFMEQRAPGTLRIWAEPFTPLRVPKLFNLRTDPFEYADITSNTYYDWLMHHDFFVFYGTAICTQFLETFKEFPPRHPPASFSIDQAVEKLHDFLARD